MRVFIVAPLRTLRNGWPRLLGAAEAIGVLLRDAGVRWSDDACYRLGASLAYYALFSLFPLALIALTAIGVFLGDGDSVRQHLIAFVGGTTSPESRVLLDQTLQSMQTHRTARGIGAIVGALTLLLGASGVFSELQSSLNLIWRVKAASQSGIWASLLYALRAKVYSFAVVLAAAIALLASLILSTALGTAGSGTFALQVGVRVFWRILEACGSVGLLALLLAATYRIVPQTRVVWRDVLGAALFTSFLLSGLKYLLAWYLAHLTSYAAYGAVGGVLGLLTWIYLATLVVLYGAEFSRLYAERFGSQRNGSPALRTESASA